MSEKKEELKLMDYYKMFFGVVLLIILYLFASNGRYKDNGGTTFIDTWTKTIYRVDGKEWGKIGEKD